MTEIKNKMSRESITPFCMLSKCVMTLKAEIISTSHGLAHCVNRLVTGGPARQDEENATT